MADRKTSLCTLCEVDLQRPKTGSHICGKCSKIYCTNCYRMKMEIEVKNEDDSPEGQCENCDELFQIKMAEKTALMGGRKTNIPLTGGRNWTVTPIKPVRSNISRENIFTGNVDTASYFPQFNSGIRNKSPNAGTLTSGYEFCDKSRRIRVQRNKRGLASISDIPNVTDNRYVILNSEENESTILSDKFNMHVDHQNIGTCSNHGEHYQVSQTPPLSTFDKTEHSVHNFERTENSMHFNQDGWNEDIQEQMSTAEPYQNSQPLPRGLQSARYNQNQSAQNDFSGKSWSQQEYNPAMNVNYHGSSTSSSPGQHSQAAPTQPPPPSRFNYGRGQHSLYHNLDGLNEDFEETRPNDEFYHQGQSGLNRNEKEGRTFSGYSKNESQVGKHPSHTYHQKNATNTNMAQHSGVEPSHPRPYYGGMQHSTYTDQYNWNQMSKDADGQLYPRTQPSSQELRHSEYNPTQMSHYPFSDISGSQNSSNSGNRLYNRVPTSPPYDNSQPEFGRYNHTAGTPTGGRAFQSSTEDFYVDDPYLRDEEIEDLVNVPALEDIPYALILAGKVDAKTLRNASRKQEQLDMLKFVNEGKTQKAGAKVTKNKNAGPIKILNEVSLNRDGNREAQVENQLTRRTTEMTEKRFSDFPGSNEKENIHVTEDITRNDIAFGHRTNNSIDISPGRTGESEKQTEKQKGKQDNKPYNIYVKQNAVKESSTLLVSDVRFISPPVAGVKESAHSPVSEVRNTPYALTDNGNDRTRSPVTEVKEMPFAIVADVKERKRTPVTETKYMEHSYNAEVSDKAHPLAGNIDLIADVKKSLHSPVTDIKSRAHLADDVEENMTNSSVTISATQSINDSRDSVMNEKTNNLDNDKTETKNEKFLREKRLQALNSGQSEKVVDKQNNGDSSKSKACNRDRTYRLDDNLKPVKSKAFKSQVPIFKDSTEFACNSAEQNTTDNKQDATTVGAVEKKSQMQTNIRKLDNHQPSKSQTIHNIHDTMHDKETLLKNKEDVESKDGIELESESDQVPLAMRMLKENSKANRRGELNSASSTGPIAMRLLRQANTAKENNSDFPDMLSIASADDDDGEPKNPDEPIAMRLLRQPNTMKERRKAHGAGTFPSGEHSVETLLSSIFGIHPSGAFNRSNTGEDSSYDDSSSSPKKANKNKNKNKNATSDKFKSSSEENRMRKYDSSAENSVEQSDERPRSLIIVDLGSNNNADSDGSRRSNTRSKNEAISVLLIATNRHKAFQKLKMAKGEGDIRCTGCGRPDCKGQNVEKMKEVIQIAQQAGFEVRDVIPDGNCMFAAVVDQLNMYGDNRFGHKSLREAAVTWLIEHPYNEDGTHYSSFMSEEWDTYIQRMMMVGEWGDHVVLQAVVEVVGHTIKILNVSEKESHWTIMEPMFIDASKDSMHLVLGHVGEFHYISLRPCDKKDLSSPGMVPARSDLVLTEDIAQLKLDGTETVQMFKEDYIDTWSDMPAPHFSFLLKAVIPIKVIDEAAISSSQILDKYNEINQADISKGDLQSFTREYAGSIAEAVYVPHLNTKIHEDASVEDTVSLDAYLILTTYTVVESLSDSPPDSDDEYFTLDTSGVHIGYAKVLKTVRYSDGRRMSKHFPSYSFRNDSDISFRGPSGASFVKRSECPALKCVYWPTVAKPWITRERLEGWPSEKVISEIVSDGCILIPFPHSASKSPDTEWQFSFALTERKLFQDGVSKHQKYCYILFDALCKQTMQSLETISSSHTKSVFFYACERIPSEFWETSPGACVLYMLDELLRYVRTKNLPNYFIQANNMLDHLRDAELKEIEEQIILLRSQPILFLRQIDEGLKYLPLSNSVIEKVSDDFASFKEHRSLRRSMLEIFIPATIKVSHEYIKHFRFEEGFEMLSQAFQDRLAVSTCDDSLPFEVFLQGAVSGLDLSSLVWFSAYADKQLQGQLSKSLIRVTCGDMTLTRIRDVLPVDVAGSFGDSEVPQEMACQLCSFCNEFARFLYSINKMSDILPVLYHCHAIYQENASSNPSLQNGTATGKSENEPTRENDFTDEAMFQIYTAMFHVYNRQHQLEFFRSILPHMEAVCDRINRKWTFQCLATMYRWLHDEEGLNRVKEKFASAPLNPLDNMMLQLFNNWPSSRLTYVNSS